MADEISVGVARPSRRSSIDRRRWITVTQSKCVCSMRFPLLPASPPLPPRDAPRRDLSSDSLGRWTKTPQKLTVSSRPGKRLGITEPTFFVLSLTAPCENRREFDRNHGRGAETTAGLVFSKRVERELLSVCCNNRCFWTAIRHI